jgi:hypothetical protein
MADLISESIVGHPNSPDADQFVGVLIATIDLSLDWPYRAGSVSGDSQSSHSKGTFEAASELG